MTRQGGGPEQSTASWGRRIAWFVALWTAGVGSAGLVAYLIRWALGG